MALIRCPECGREVSDQAKACPHCAYPIAQRSPSGQVRIKMSAVPRATMGGRQQARVYADGNLVWEGQVGQVAEIFFPKASTVTIQYVMNMLYYGGSCTGIIDPAKGRVYNVHVRQGLMKIIMELQRVDILDGG